MTKPAASLRLLAPSEFGRRVRTPPLGRTKAIEVMSRIGGWKDPDLGGWVIPERLVIEYLRRKHREQPCRDSQGDSTAYPSTDGEVTGSATSETQQASATSAHYTSETTEQKPASEQQSPPTGKSKAALRLERMLARAPRSGSAQRSKRSNGPKS